MLRTRNLGISIKLLFVFALVGAMGWFALPGHTASRQEAAIPISADTQAAQATKAQVSEAYGQLPMSFEANRGQTDSEVKFLSRGNGYSLFLTSTEAVITLPMRRHEDPKMRESNGETTAASQALASSTSSANPQSAIRNRRYCG